MKPEIENRYRSDFLVLLVEEYGYRRWFWFPSMGKDDLEKWWAQLETVVPYFMTPKSLPGELYQVAVGDESDLFIELERAGSHYFAHTHCDDDSVLIRPDKTKLFHKGFEES